MGKAPVNRALREVAIKFADLHSHSLMALIKRSDRNDGPTWNTSVTAIAVRIVYELRVHYMRARSQDLRTFRRPRSKARALNQTELNERAAQVLFT